jgi:hypothetical protein
MDFPALSFEVHQRRQSCVLDPALALSRFGPSLARGLRGGLEVWVVPELWHILENAIVFMERPELLSASRRTGRTERAGWSELSRDRLDLVHALRGWEQLRYHSASQDIGLYWPGEQPSEGFLPPGVEVDLISRWMALAQELDHSLSSAAGNTNPLNAAWRDSTALLAALGSAFLLARRNVEDVFDSAKPPPICVALERWGVPSVSVDLSDRLVQLERARLADTVVCCGLSKYLWAGQRLAVVHIVAPNSCSVMDEDKSEELPTTLADHDAMAGLPTPSTRSGHYAGDNLVSDKEYAAPPSPPWRRSWINAQAFWYEL